MGVRLGERPFDPLALIRKHAHSPFLIGHFDESRLLAFVEMAVDRMPKLRIDACVRGLTVFGCVGEVGTANPVGRNRARKIAENVVGGIGIAERIEQRRVSRDHMVGLHERFLASLPVTSNHLRDVHRLELLLHRERLEMRIEPFQESRKRLRVPIGVDEDQPSPTTDLRLAQAVILLVDVREIPFTGNLLHRPVEIPAPAVEGAAQISRAAPIRFAQQTPPVQARIAIGLDVLRALAGSHDQEREMRDVVDIVVADVRDLVLVAGELPDTTPELLDLQVMKLFRVVDARRNDRVARRHRRLGAQCIGDRMRVLLQ